MLQRIWQALVEDLSEEEALEQKKRALNLMWNYLAEGASDFHMHSNASDGTSSPAQLVQQAINHGLKSFSLTDHDTIEGNAVVSMVYDKLSHVQVPLPEFVPGVELSANFDKQEIHILAYYPIGNIRLLDNFLAARRLERELRNKQLCEKVQEAGMNIDYDDFIHEGGHVIGRLHMAQLMIRKGYATTVDQAFNSFLAEGRPCYVKRSLPSAQAVLTEIKKTGGIGVLAHPAIYKDWLRDNKKSDEKLRDIFMILKDQGLDGVEVLHGETSEEESRIIAKLASEANLLPTIGSDYHGSHKPNIPMFKATNPGLDILRSYFPHI